MIFRLRHSLADSPPCPAESDSLSCGLPFRFQLLSTPFRNHAVTFSYDVMAYADRDFHPVDKFPLWAHKWQASLVARSRVVPRSDSACVSTERFLRSGNAGFTKSRRVIGEHVSHPLVGWRTSDQDGWGLRSNLICRGIFEDFHAGSKGNLYSKIATPRFIADGWRR